LISNSEIRYEGILYTINTGESTIALQSVKTFGTEGRKIPEIPPSSEIYDFIIFRGQDIKDLTVLEGAQGQSAAMFSDPAIMSMNQRPSGGPGKDGAKGFGKAAQPKGYDNKGDKGGGKGAPAPAAAPAWGGKGLPAWATGAAQQQQSSKGEAAWGGGRGESWGAKGDGWGKGDAAWWGGGGKGGDGWGRAGGAWGAEGGKGRAGKDSWGGAWGGKGGGKDAGAGRWPATEKGGGKGKDGGKKGGGKGKDDGKGSKGKSKGDAKGKGDGKGDRGGKGRSGGKGKDTVGGAPVGELVPEKNSEAKKEYAEDFDLTAASTKFEKVTDSADKQPLSGYNKTSSFFDNISCEATDRAADTEHVKVDRDKARQYDKETFGDTRRPPRPVGARRGKGKGKGGGK